MPSFKDFINPNLYHGSQKLFPNGFILKPQNDGYTFLPEVQIEEGILEYYRPKNKLSRKKSVFMVSDIDEIDSAGGYLDYVYEVQPLDKVEISDMHYYSELSIEISEWGRESDIPESVKEQLALAYWSGKHSGTNDSLMEYRTSSAKIIKLVHKEN